MIKATDIHKSYGALEVLRGVSLEVSRGEVVSIVGASGAGKTTLLQILGTLSKADRGSVEIDGQDVSSLGDRALSGSVTRRSDSFSSSTTCCPNLRLSRMSVSPA